MSGLMRLFLCVYTIKRVHCRLRRGGDTKKNSARSSEKESGPLPASRISVPW